MSQVEISFEIHDPSGATRTETFVQRVIKIGKLSSSHLRIEDDDVSRHHAVINVEGDDESPRVVIIATAAGVVVNGAKVDKARLESGDTLTLGATRVVVTITVKEGVMPTAAASIPPAATASPSTPPLGGAPVGGIGLPAGLPFQGVPGSPLANQRVAQAQPQGEVRYGLAASGPPVPAEEVETGNAAIEVVVMWGDQQVLHASQLSPPRNFYVGEQTAVKGQAPIDFLMGSELIGTDRLPVVIAQGEAPAAVIPDGATGEVVGADGARMSFEQLAAAGKLQPCSEAPGAKQITLPRGATAYVRFKGMTFVVRPVQAAKRIGIGKFSIASLFAGAGMFWILTSFAMHGVLVAAMFFIPPGSSSLSLDELMNDDRLARYLIQTPETEEIETPDFLQENRDDNEGGKGKRHKNEEGAMGKQESKKTNNRYAIQGPQDNQDPHMAREAAREMARTAGALGALRAMVGSFNSPTSEFGRDTALGTDAISALGALMGDQPGENFGFGGLGLRGTGRGGGGTGEGTIGLGNVGTIGHGAGGGEGSGYGRGAGGFSGRQARVPRIRAGNADVRGSLSKEVIRRVIQRHINEVRFCYEQELNSRPDLEGRVTVSFIISPTGAVQTATVANSDMGNPRVEGCIAQSVRRWNFPSPEGGGIVLVNYPFVLQAAGGGE